MSLNSGDKGSVAGASSGLAQLQAPRLQYGGYAAWRPSMDVFLQRNGAEGIHKRPMTEKDWVATSEKVGVWAEEAYAAAMALALSGDGSNDSSTTTTTTTSAPSEQVKAARALVGATVERSRKVYGVLYSALPDDLRAQVAHLPQGWAFGLWDWLEKKFQNTEEDSVGELLSHWTMLRQSEEESFDAYRARVNRLYTLLAQAKEKQSARMYAHMLLDRLQPRYKQAVLAMKAGGQLKEIDKVQWDAVASFINSHERLEQRFGDAAFEEAASSNKALVARRDDNRATKKQSPMGAASSSGRSDAASSGDGEHRRVRTLDDVQCFNCEGYGHLSRRCPKPRKGAKSATSPATSSSPSNKAAPSGARGADSGSRSRSPVQGSAHCVNTSNRFGALSETGDRKCDEQPTARHTVAVAQLGRTYAGAVRNGLQPVHPPQKEEERASSKPQQSPRGAAAAAVLGEPVKAPSESASDARAPKQAALPSKKKEMQPAFATPRVKGADRHAWGIDSMASLHISGQRQLFHSLRRCRPVAVEVANGDVVTAQHRGPVTLRVMSATGQPLRMVIDGVYYHERFAANLLSWDTLRLKGWELHSTPLGTKVTTPSKKQITLRTKGRVSIMESAAPVASLGSTIRERVCGVREMDCSSADALMRQHERLGHMGVDRLLALLKSGATEDIGRLCISEKELKLARRRILECKACLLAKGTRTAFGHRGLDKGSAPGETLHMDTYYAVLKQDGELRQVEYGLTVIDPHTEWRWHAFLPSKDHAAKEVKRIVRNAQTQLGCKVKRLYADGGTEFINRTLKGFCNEEGIELHYPPARTQQLNGVAERSVRSGKEMMNSMLVHACAPMKLWSYAASHTAYVWNRTHVAKATGVTPYEAMYKKKPSTYHVGVFACDAFCHVPKQFREGTLAPRMEPCIYLGHDEVRNCATLLVLSKMKLLYSRDVIYREGSFANVAAFAAGDDCVRDVVDAGYTEQPEADTICIGLDAGPQEASASVPDSESAPEPAAAADAEPHDEEYDVERILGKRIRRGHTEYRVQWAGYDEADATWEPADFVDGAKDLIDAFESAHAQAQEHGAAEAGAAPRRSPRFQPAPAETKEDDDGDDDAATGPQVHMAMCALRNLQCEEYPPNIRSNLVYAVSAGVGLLDQNTPTTYRAAVSGPDAAKWKAGMDKEMESCEKMQVWTLVPRKDLPRGANVLPVKWVYKIKTDEFGNVTQHKSRLTPKGFRQKIGVDCFEVFARTGMYKSMRAGLSLTAKWDYELSQLDVPTAFLNADVEEEVYMELPDGYRDGKEHLVCKLNKSLYGLKQSPRNWYLLVCRFILEKLGFKACVSDPCLFYQRSRTGRLILLFLFVDDFQGSYHRDDEAEWDEIKAKLVDRFQTKDMGESKWILGMKISRDRKTRTITLDQELYVTKALERYGLAQCKVAATPEAVGAQHDAAPGLDEAADKQRFMEITGTLMYAAISTRPDIAHGVHYLASNMVAPTKRHMLAAERVLRYLAGTRDLGLVFGSRNGAEVGDSRGRLKLQVDVCAYADADWANNKGDRKSITGWVAKLNGDPISWSSKKQRTVALSTCEAELYAEAAAIQEVLWLRGLLKELGLHIQTGSVVHGDNQSTIAISKNGVKSERTKHVDVKYHFITETIEGGEVQLKWVPTNEQQADIFTKALAQPVFEHFRQQLMTR
jgi:transposase InsO family protein